MPYGNLLADVVQGSTANTAPVFKDGNGTAIGTLCRAWVNFNGTGTVAIRASFNVSSITDNGTGDYTVNFTTALPDANYSLAGFARRDNDSGGVFTIISALASDTKTTSACKVRAFFQLGGSTSLVDCPEIDVSIFR